MNLTYLTTPIRRLGSRLSLALEILPDLRQQIDTQVKSASPRELASLRRTVNRRAEIGAGASAACFLMAALGGISQLLVGLLLGFIGVLALTYAGAWHLISEGRVGDE